LTKQWSITCHMESRNVTCYPTQVNTPRLNPSQTGRYSIYLPRRDGRLSCCSSYSFRLITSDIKNTTGRGEAASGTQSVLPIGFFFVRTCYMMSDDRLFDFFKTLVRSLRYVLYMYTVAVCSIDEFFLCTLSPPDCV